MNPYAARHDSYTSASVLTAPPERLVVMLYDGAIRFLNQAATAMRAGETDVWSNRMHRATAIIDELNWTLDMKQGGVAERLRSIYLFCKRHLNDARLQRDPAKIEQVVRLLSELREAWQQIAAGATPSVAAA